MKIINDWKVFWRKINGVSYRGVQLILLNSIIALAMFCLLVAISWKSVSAFFKK